MKCIPAFILLLLVLSFGHVEQAEGSPRFHRCIRRCTRNRRAIRVCIRFRAFCRLRRCRRGRWRCPPRRRPRPTPTRTSTPTPTPTSSPTPTSTPTPTPTPTSTPSVSPTPSPIIGDPQTAYCWGDPHIVTFDGLRYDCQASGEFILAKSATSDQFEIQGRFRVSPGRPFSLSSGIAAVEEGSPRVEFSLAQIVTTAAISIRGCRVSVYIDGVNSMFTPGTHFREPNRNTRITVTSSSLRVDYLSGMRVHVTVNTAGSFGCWFGNMVVTVPGQTIADGPIRGLFGSPNGNRNDDWMTATGVVLPISPDLRGLPATNYCVNNWRVDEAESLFTRERPFEAPVIPGSLTQTGPNLDNAPANIVAICGGNAACLIDSILGDADLARTTLANEEEAEDIADEPIFEPPTISAAPARFSKDVYERMAKKQYGSFYSN